jgi:P-type Ca2+ transporter type 2B
MTYNYVCMQVSTTPGELPIQIGNKTECALLGFMQLLGERYQDFRELYPETALHKVFTFSSARKTMSTVVRKLDRSGFVLYTKGAPERVLQNCAFVLDDEGDPVPLTPQRVTDISTNVIDAMATRCAPSR